MLVVEDSVDNFEIDLCFGETQIETKLKNSEILRVLNIMQ